MCVEQFSIELSQDMQLSGKITYQGKFSIKVSEGNTRTCNMRHNLACSMYVVPSWYALCNILYIHNTITFSCTCLYNGHMYFHILGKM